jgi:hypothetical protein
MTQIHSDYSNWIIPDWVMCGPYPYCDGINFNEEEGKKNIDSILNDGIDTFVCLCKEISLDSNQKDKEGHPYFPIFKSYRDYISSLALKKMIIFKYYPIDDGGIPEVKDLVWQIEELLTLLKKGRKIYIHCAGGHGRTNIYTAILVSALSNIIPEFALDHVFKQRKLRRKKDKKLEIYNIPEDDRYIIFNKHQEEIVKIVSHYFLVKNQLESN